MNEIHAWVADYTLESLLIWWKGPSVLFFPDLHGALSVTASNSLCRVTAFYIYTCISVYMAFFICRYTFGSSRLHCILLDTLVSTNKLLKNAILKEKNSPGSGVPSWWGWPPHYPNHSFRNTSTTKDSPESRMVSLNKIQTNNLSPLSQIYSSLTGLPPRRWQQGTWEMNHPYVFLLVFEWVKSLRSTHFHGSQEISLKSTNFPKLVLNTILWMVYSA